MNLEQMMQEIAAAPVGVGYSYSIQDLRRAAFSGRPLEARKALAARKAFERKIDRMAALAAESARGIGTGICNKTVGTTAGTVRGTAFTAAAWDDTPDRLPLHLIPWAGLPALP